MSILINNCISCSNDLITSREQTRAGFIEAALEKNRKAQPFIDSAKSLKSLAVRVSRPMDLLSVPGLRFGLLAASGLSDKSLKYFRDEDKVVAITKMIEQCLVPAGDGFVDEFIYRYLLIKGDSLGGSMRNYVGNIAKTKLTRKLLTMLNLYNISYKVLTKEKKLSNEWTEMSFGDDYEEAEKLNAITWKYNGKSKVVFFDTTLPIVKKNIDICLYSGDEFSYDGGRIIRNDSNAIMLGELKGGIDPAGADEHWKTGNTALERIRKAFNAHNISVKTSFIAAAIETNMSVEIWNQLEEGRLSNAANITVDEQLTNYCDWIIKL